jgi:hypothetical protein
MRYIFILFFICVVNKLEAQSPPPVTLPEFLPPSPDVAAIIKGAELSASPHTGAANASIPIYELKIKDFSLPVSMNYSSNGFKPNETSSRCGMGWSLNVGGVVSRIQLGKPDDYCTTPTPKTISELLQYDAAALAYITDLEDPGSYHDAQPDEYRYSVNGISGKFIIKRDGNVIQLPYNNLKIVAIISGGALDEVQITDDKGILYKFGTSTAIEETIEHTLVHFMIGKQHIRTAWMLTKIVLPTGEYIDFTYSEIDHWNVTGTSVSVSRGMYEDQLCGGSEPACTNVLNTTSKVDQVKYKSWYLTSVVASTGQGISIYYGDRPDVGGDNRVDSIKIAYNGTIIKSAAIEYASAAGSQPLTDINGQFFLKKVIFKDPTGGSAPSQEFVLKYVDTGTEFETPGGEDHLGFATDGISSTPIPPLTEDEEIFASYITSKNPNGNKSKIGMLQRITYPTGGYDEFSYEPNMKSWWDSVDVTNIVSARVSGYGDVSPFRQYNKIFTVSRAQVGEFHLSTQWWGDPPVPGGDPAPKSAYAWLYNNTTSEVIMMRRAEGFPGGENYLVTGDLPVNLYPGIEYRLELEVRFGTQAFAQADIVYDAGNTKAWKNLKEELCGVRVHKVVNYDPVTNKSVSKFYKYASIFDTLTPSANKLYYPEYITWNSVAMACPAQNFQKICFSKVWSNNSVTSIYVNDAGGVTYKWVTESDDSTFANGGIEHSFYTQGAFVGAPVIGSDIPNRPTDAYNFRNGIDTQQIYFNKDLAIVKKVNNYYSYDSHVDDMQQLNYFLRKRYEPIYTVYPVGQHSFDQFDVMQYSVYTYWDHLDSTVIREYDIPNNKMMLTKTSYESGTEANVQPAIIRTLGSDNIERRTEFKYPTDYSPPGIYAEMVIRNIKLPVIEEASYKDTKLLFKKTTEYKDWSNDYSRILPELVKIQKNTNSNEIRIHFYQYAANGNPVELSKENDARMSYIWDYNGTLPIAEISNASFGSGVAYTSFEADGKGGWTFTGAPGTEGTEPGGNKSYLITNGNITYTTGLTSGKKYYVSYWSKGGTITVNGGAGTTQLTKNGWTLSRKLITYSGSGGITVSGSGRVDELRLYPEGAFMKSFTYNPEIGITSGADVNNLIQRYEYDAFNRLLRIRDMDNNILKQIEYKYGESITACPTSTANWVATGNYRCVKTNAWGNNNTGEREREEKDMNNCSSTYHQLRYISEGNSLSCPIVSNCTGADKRVINGVCKTGCKLIVASEYLGNLQWRCTYHYFWEDDGFVSQDFVETGNTHCIMICD